MPKRLSMMDSVFLLGETRESMMHVGGLLPFTPPADATPRFLRDLTDELRASAEVASPWNLRLRTAHLKNPVQSWVEQRELDIEYHVRRSALPAPGDERELGVLVSRLHGIALDFERPPWELHLIEGLSRGRFALYFKIHHALVDGYTAMRMLAASLSTDPGERDTPMFFLTPPPARAPRDVEVPTLASLMEIARGHGRDLRTALATLVHTARAEDPDLVSPLQAPHSILNRRISRNRRFATQQYSLERVRELARASGGTVNDVCLAVVATGLRRLLLELDALPAKPLIAMLPVNVRPKDDPGGGNAVGAILASLATHVDDPLERLYTIIASTRAAKEQLAGMSKNAILQYTAMLMAPMSVQQIAGVPGRLPPGFNVVISNVPGPDRPLYFRGARLEALYPLSIPFHGYGLNITINGYADTLNFGYTGCRDTVPRLQRLAVYGGEGLDELERALG